MKRFLSALILIGVLIQPCLFAQITSTAPTIEFRETDQTLPLGFWRLRLDSNAFSLHKSTATDRSWSTFTVPWTVDVSGNFTALGSITGGGHIYTVASKGIAIGTASAPAGAFLEGLEITAPGVGAANTWRLYAVDDGGKTKLYVQFRTGAAQLLATEP